MKKLSLLQIFFEDIFRKTEDEEDNGKTFIAQTSVVYPRQDFTFSGQNHNIHALHPVTQQKAVLWPKEALRKDLFLTSHLCCRWLKAVIMTSL